MATLTATNIERVRALRELAANLRGAEERWRTKYADKKHYDKQGFGFTYRTEVSWNAFNTPALGFEAYVGVYGSSSCGNAWRIDGELAKRYFCKALNQHKQAIFDSMADLAEADANELRKGAEAELEKLRLLLAGAEAEQVSA